MENTTEINLLKILFSISVILTFLDVVIQILTGFSVEGQLGNYLIVIFVNCILYYMQGFSEYYRKIQKGDKFIDLFKDMFQEDVFHDEA